MIFIVWYSKRFLTELNESCALQINANEDTQAGFNNLLSVRPLLMALMSVYRRENLSKISRLHVNTNTRSFNRSSIYSKKKDSAHSDDDRRFS